MKACCNIITLAAPPEQYDILRARLYQELEAHDAAKGIRRQWTLYIAATDDLHATLAAIRMARPPSVFYHAIGTRLAEFDPKQEKGRQEIYGRLLWECTTLCTTIIHRETKPYVVVEDDIPEEILKMYQDYEPDGLFASRGPLADVIRRLVDGEALAA